MGDPEEGPGRLPRAWTLLLFANFLAYTWWGWGAYFHHLIDTYQSCYVPVAIAAGEVPYLDFTYYFGPLAVVVYGAVLSLTTVRLEVIALLGLLTIAVTLVLLNLVAAELALPPDARAVSCLLFLNGFAFNNAHSVRLFNWAVPYSHSSTQACLMLLVAVLFALRWGRRRLLSDAIIWGVAAAGIALNRHDLGLLFALLSLLYACRVGPPSPKQAVAWGLAFSLPVLLIYGYFAYRAGWSTLLLDNLFWKGHDPRINPHQSYIFGGSRTLGQVCLVASVHLLAWFLAGRLSPAQQRLGIPLLALACLVVIPLEAGLLDIQLLLLLLLLTGPKKPAAEVFLGLLSAGLLARILLRPVVTSYFFFLGVLPSLLLVTLAWKAARHRGQQAFLLGLMMLMSGRHAYYNAESFLRQSVRVATPRGALTMLPSESALAFAEVIRRVGLEAEGKTLLVLPEGALLNVLTGSRHPMATPTLSPAVFAAENEERLLKEVQQAQPDFVIFLHRLTPEFGAGQFGVDKGLGIERWVKENYRLIGRFGPTPFETQGPEGGGALLYQRGPIGELPRSPD